MAPHASDSGEFYEAPEDAARASLASAARTASANGTAFATEDINELEAELVVSAHAGTTPTLDVKLQTKTDDGAYYDVASFPQVGDANGTTGRVFTGLGDTCRWVWAIAGTTPSYTFAINAEAERD